MKVLAIGNSFSEDAMRYLHQIAGADNFSMKVVNLFIGGCSLEMHYENMLAHKIAYSLEFNGETTGFYVSLLQALESDKWDVITLQQVSYLAPDYETYQPFLNELAEYVRQRCPNARLFIHQTWAYEAESFRLREELGYERPQQMLDAVVSANAKAAADINADGIIPSGELFDALLDGGIEKIHRDTFHASLGLGRYALGLLWYYKLTGRDVESNSFAAFDEPVSEDEINLVKRTVKSL